MKSTGSSQKDAVPPLSPVVVGTGLLVILGIGWLITLILSASTLSSDAYVRWKTRQIRNDVVAVSCVPNATLDNVLVHIDCPIKNAHSFKIPQEFAPNIGSYSGAFLEMKVEMYQGQASLMGLRKAGWYDHLVSRRSGPGFMPYVPGAGRKFASEVYGGGFRLASSSAVNIKSTRVLDLLEDNVYEPSLERPPAKITSKNTQVYQNALYTGDPLRPRVGDVRIQFLGSAASHVSAIGIQKTNANEFWEKIDPRSITRRLEGFTDVFASDTGAKKVLVREGDFTAQELIDMYERQNNAFHGVHAYVLVLFAICTAAFAFFLLRKKRQGSLEKQRLVFTLTAAILVAFGSTLIISGLTHLFVAPLLSSAQIIAGFASLSAAYLFDRSTTELSSYLPLVEEPMNEAMSTGLYKDRTKSYAAV